MPAKAPMLKKPSASDVEAMVISHERALFGYTDRDSLRIVPGLLARIDEAHHDINEMKADIFLVKKSLEGVPDLIATAKQIKRYGSWGTGAIILGLLAVIFHQYGLLPAILNAVGH